MTTSADRPISVMLVGMGRRSWTPPSVMFRASDVGVAPDVLRRAVSRGEVVRMHRGVYLAADLVPTDDVQRHIVSATAVQMARGDLIASHGTAALAHELPLLNRAEVAEAPPVFTRPPAPGRRSESEPRVMLRKLPPDVVTDHENDVGGLRLTTPARTALDLASELPLTEALMATDHVARQAALGYVVSRDLRGKVNPQVLERALRPLREAQVARAHSQCRVGRALQLTDPRRESPAESVSFGRIVEAGLPVPDCQHEFVQGSGKGVFVDFWWEEFRVAGECHGKIKYDGSFGHDDGVLVREADRHHFLLSIGISVVHWRAADMMFRPAAVLANIASRLSAGGWRG